MESVLTQDYTDLEIICVNDGSTDASLSMLREYEKRDARVRIIDVPNGGYGRAMNLGMDAATGEYFAILEPDDYLPKGVYTKLVQLAQKHNADIAKGCGCMNYSDLSVPYTRAHEHNYFSPWETHEKSILMQEFSHESTRDTTKMYPKRMAADMEIFRRYLPQTEREDGVSFIGRLGCYRYLDMHHCVALALDYAEKWLAWHSGNTPTLPKMPE